jgi:hypothetical protein
LGDAAGGAAGTTVSLVAPASATAPACSDPRTPRPTETPRRKITTATTTADMNTNTSCFPLSWIS